MEWYLEVLKKYAVFGGRAGRKEFWIFYLINFVILMVLTFIESNINQPPWGSVSLIAGIYALFAALPTLAVIVRRLHDTNRSGWWIFIGTIPFGIIVLLVLLAEKSYIGDNEYGSNPENCSQDISV